MHLSSGKGFIIRMNIGVIGIMMMSLFTAHHTTAADIDTIESILKGLQDIAEGTDRETILQRLRTEHHVIPVGSGTFEERHAMMLFTMFSVQSACGPGKHANNAIQGTHSFCLLGHLHLLRLFWLFNGVFRPLVI